MPMVSKQRNYVAKRAKGSFTVQCTLVSPKDQPHLLCVFVYCYVDWNKTKKTIAFLSHAKWLFMYFD